MKILMCSKVGSINSASEKEIPIGYSETILNQSAKNLHLRYCEKTMIMK